MRKRTFSSMPGSTESSTAASWRSRSTSSSTSCSGADAPAVTPTVDTFVDVSAVSGYLSAGDTLVGQSLKILIQQNDAASSSAQRQNFYDNVRLTALVPEPSAVGVLAMSGLFVLRRRARS